LACHSSFLITIIEPLRIMVAVAASMALTRRLDQVLAEDPAASKRRANFVSLSCTKLAEKGPWGQNLTSFLDARNFDELLSQVKIGNAIQQERALTEIHARITGTDEKAVVVLCREHGLTILTKALCSETCKRKDLIAIVLEDVAAKGLWYVRQIRDSGAVHVLIGVIKRGSPTEKRVAVAVLSHMAPVCADDIVMQGGISALIRTAKGGTPAQQKGAKAALRGIAAGLEGRHPHVLEAIANLGYNVP